MRKNVIFILFILLNPHLELCAQNVFGKRYTVADLLPSNICYKVTQDDKGFIVIGTEKGIVIFDGYVFRPIKLHNKLSDLDVWDVFKDLEGRLWLSTKQNRCEFIFQDSVYDINKLIPEISDFKVDFNCKLSPLIYRSPTNDTQIYYLDKRQHLIGQKISYAMKKWILNQEGKLCYWDVMPNKIIALSANKEFMVYDWGSRTMSLKSFKEPITQLLNTARHSHNIPEAYYFSSGDSIFSIKEVSVKYVTTYTNSGFSKNTAMVGVFNQSFICTKGNTLFVVDSLFAPQDCVLPLIKYPVHQVYEDNEHNLWFNTIESGIYFVSNNMLKNRLYTSENGLNNSHIVSLESKSSGNLYIGNYKEPKIQVLSKGRFYDIPTNASKAYSMISFENGDLVVSNGYISKHPYKFNFPQSYHSLAVIRVAPYYVHDLRLNTKCLYKIDEQSFLLNSRNDFLKCTKRSNYTFDIEELGKTETDIYTICRLNNSYLLGTASGLYQYQNGKMKNLRYLSSAFNSNIRSIKTDNEGRIWIAGDQFTLACYDSHFRKTLDFPEMNNSVVTAITIDTFNHSVLASSSDGLYKITIDSASTDHYKLFRYTVADGLPSNEVNAAAVDKQYIYVGTSFGMCLLAKEKLDYTYIPKIYCTKVSSNNMDIPIRSTYQLPYDKNNIRIELTSLSYQSLGNIKYYYRLLGAGKEWTHTNQRTIEFSSLKTGVYTFEAFAIDAYNNKTQNKIVITFHIIPPFWKTWWFNMLMLLLLMTGIIALIYWRLHRHRNKELKEANINKQLAELKLNALQSQLNSHFVFNSLNAIQKFMLNNNEVEASEYMSKFAKLIRLFLESSRNKSTELSNEIELISIYASLEQLRFEDKFELILDTKKVQHFDIQFPTNILQPFVENAIIHGLMHRTSKGLLKIDFLETEEYIKCVIDDNGIGRKQSAIISSKKNRNSLGMTLIQDKITNLNNIFSHRISIEVIDKESTENAEHTGTIVNIICTK